MEDTTKTMNSVLQSTHEMNSADDPLSQKHDNCINVGGSSTSIDTPVGNEYLPSHRVISEPIGSIINTTENISPQLDNMAQNRINAGSSVDPKRMKRILSNRESARRSRIRKQERITELERKVNELEVEVDSLTTQRINHYDTRWMIVKAENRVMKETVCRLTNEIAIKDAQIEQLKQEREILLNLQLQPQHGQQIHREQITGYDNNEPQIFNPNSSNFFM